MQTHNSLSFKSMVMKATHCSGECCSLATAPTLGLWDPDSGCDNSFRQTSEKMAAE